MQAPETLWPRATLVPKKLRLPRATTVLEVADPWRLSECGAWKQVVTMLAMPGVIVLCECLVHATRTVLPIPGQEFRELCRLYASDFLSLNRDVVAYRFYVFVPNAPSTAATWPNAIMMADARVCADQSNQRKYYCNNKNRIYFPLPQCVFQVDAAPAADLLQRCRPDKQALQWTEAMRNFAGERGLPPPGDIIDTWLRQPEVQQRSSVRLPVNTIDERLSLFGARMVRLIAQLDVSRNVHGAHVAVAVCTIASHTAYFQQQGLHANVLLVGAADVSKSFVLDVVKSLLIPDTVSPLTRQTMAAADTNTHERGIIRVMHEVPDELLIAAKRSGSKAAAIQTTFKNYLTSGEVTVQRSTGTTRSVKQMAFLGASNMRAADIAAPIATRFLLVPMRASGARQDKLMAQTVLSHLSANGSGSTGQFQDELAHEMRLTQAMTYYMMSAVGMGAIPDVTFAVFALLVPLYCRVLSARFGISVPNRDIERMLHYTRVLVMWQAAWWLYVDPQSPVVGQPPSKLHALLASPMLRDSEEIVFFVLDLLSSQLVPADRNAVIGAVRKLACAALVANDVAEADASRETKYVYTTETLAAFTATVAERAGVSIAVATSVLKVLQTENVRSMPYIRNPLGIIEPSRQGDLIELKPVCVMNEKVLVARAWTTHPALSLHDIAILGCCSVYTPANAVYIRGTPISDAKPHLLDTRIMQPARERILNQPCRNIAHSMATLLGVGAPVAAAEADATTFGAAIQCSIDQYAAEQRFRAIGLTATPALLQKFDPRAAVKINAAAHYPADCEADVTHAAKRLRREEKEQVFDD